jgi:D-arginine dehydrogenase
MERRKAQFVIIGGGIAGISAGAWLARYGATILVERESQPAYHSTGRSVAFYLEYYGNAVIRALTRASGKFLKAPPQGFSDHPILSPRGSLNIARSDQMEELRAAAQVVASGGGRSQFLSWKEAMALVPVLAPEYGAGALLEPDAMDIDIHALLQGYLRLFRSDGGALITDAEVTGLECLEGAWEVITPNLRIEAPIVINAAGAWADTVAQLAGLPALSITPLRRSVAVIDALAGLNVEKWPLLNDVGEEFYVKPDAGRLLLSPADETPSPPCDARPEDLDLALAVDRLETATTLKPKRLLQRWAGLRSFAPDRTPVVGFDPKAEGFMWLAGQGGYGIQTSAALGRIAAALASGAEIPADIAEEGVRTADLSPARFQ